MYIEQFYSIICWTSFCSPLTIFLQVISSVTEMLSCIWWPLPASHFLVTFYFCLCDQTIPYWLNYLVRELWNCSVLVQFALWNAISFIQFSYVMNLDWIKQDKDVEKIGRRLAISLAVILPIFTQTIQAFMVGNISRKYLCHSPFEFQIYSRRMSPLYVDACTLYIGGRDVFNKISAEGVTGYPLPISIIITLALVFPIYTFTIKKRRSEIL